MEELFPGYFRKSPAQIREIWANAIFALDANVLLNLYRYSTATADTFISILQQLKGKLWLPWQAAMEFHENRLGVIDKQTRTYAATAESVAKLLRLLESPREHPFIDQDLMDRVRETLNALTKGLEAQGSARKKLIHLDPKLDLISEMFKGRVGPQPDEKSRQQWLIEAKGRCERKVPPGFKDAAKDGVRPYGDTLMWFELMDFAKASKKPLVFITDDSKNDWWLEISGQTVGPLPELVQEFVRQTGQQLLFYRPDRFAEYAAEYSDSDIAPGVVDEIRTRTEDRVRRRKRRSRQFASEEATLLNELSEHLWLHREDAERLLAAVRALPLDQWKSYANPFEVPLEIRERVDGPIRRCRCLRRIVSALHEVTAPGYHAAVAEMEPKVDKDELCLLQEYRLLPTQVVDLVLSAPQRNEQ